MRRGVRSAMLAALMGGAGQPLAAADAPFRMQATALGQYLIFGVHGDFLGAGATPTSSPATDTVWQVGGSAPRGFTLTNLGTGQTIAVRFTSARGCSVYPEGDVDATGTPFRGASPRGHVPRAEAYLPPARPGARARAVDRPAAAGRDTPALPDQRGPGGVGGRDHRLRRTPRLANPLRRASRRPAMR